MTVQVPKSLVAANPVGGSASVEAENVLELLLHVAREHPEIRNRLLGPDGRMRSTVAVFVNDEDVRNLARENTPLKEGDLVAIVPALAGGAPVAEEEHRFDRDELRRYSRHLVLPEVGSAGQRRLARSKVLLVGAGGLGTPAALYLAAAGVGEIGVVDFDQVDLSNLQRQVLYTTSDVGQPKSEAARRHLSELNPHVRVVPTGERLTSANALELLRPYDVVLDGSDNFATRYLVNDACVMLGKPDVYGSVYRFEGQVTVFDGRSGPCYRCLFPEPPPAGSVPSCAEGGVLGVLPGLIGMLQATEAVKLLLGSGESLVGRLLLYDALAMKFRELTLRKNPGCPVCSAHPTQTQLIDYEAFCGTAADSLAGVESVDAVSLSGRLKTSDPPVLLDVRTREEYDLVHLPDARLIPLDELPERASEVANASEVIVYCKSGGRSARAVRLLKDLGFTRVRHLGGGLDAWVESVDPTLPTY